MNEDTGTHLHLESPENRGNISMRVEFGQKMLATIMALSIMVNVFCAWMIYDYKTEKRLQEYDLDWFKSQDFAQLKGEVSAHDKLINALQIKKECSK